MRKIMFCKHIKDIAIDELTKSQNNLAEDGTNARFHRFSESCTTIFKGLANLERRRSVIIFFVLYNYAL